MATLETPPTGIAGSGAEIADIVDADIAGAVSGADIAGASSGASSGAGSGVDIAGTDAGAGVDIAGEDADEEHLVVIEGLKQPFSIRLEFYAAYLKEPGAMAMFGWVLRDAIEEALQQKELGLVGAPLHVSAVRAVSADGEEGLQPLHELHPNADPTFWVGWLQGDSPRLRVAPVENGPELLRTFHAT